MTAEFQAAFKFQETTLGAIAKKDKHSMVDGPFGSNLPASAYVSDGVPVIRGSNLSLGKERFRSEEYVFVSEEMAQRLSRSFCYPNDIIFTKKGTLGQTGIIPRNSKYQKFLISSNQMKISVDPELAEPVFIYYYVSSPSSQKKIIQESSAAGVPKINLEYLRNFCIQLPSLPIQQRIADILSKYDRLIDNNTRRITLLEESIHRLYKEWFVYLRFPGWEKVAIVDGVPEEWRQARIENLIGLHIGGGWGKEEQEEKHSTPGFVIRGTDIPGIFSGNISGIPFRYHQENNLRSRSLCDGDLIFEVSGGSKTQGVGRTLLVTENLLNKFDGSVMCASFCKLIRPSERDLTEYLWCLLLAERDSGGLTQYESQSASNIINFKFKEFLSNKLVLFPSTQILQKFNAFVRPSFDQIHNLGFQNEKLREARDLLLPRLMNGSIAV